MPLLPGKSACAVLVPVGFCPHSRGMSEWAQFSVEESDGRTTVAITGPLRVSTISRIEPQLRAIEGPVHRVDIGDAGPVDTVGAWIVYRLARDHEAEITGAGPQVQVLLDAVEHSATDVAITPEYEGSLGKSVASVGAKVIDWGHGSTSSIAFLGAIVAAIFTSIRHPRRFRIKALVRQMELVGIDALPIVGLMSFLIGIVIAQQGAVQLQQFGAETLTVNLVGRITLRELGVLMTAIMVAGRSGSAFAAQLGTMKLTEEIDAMRTIGVAPMEALVLPRILAAVLMMPLLGFFASIMSIIGGAVIGDIALGIPFLTFLARIQEVVPLYDFYVGMVKAPVFGLIIGLAGCYQGMQVRGNAEEVGLRTTNAVVQAIFMVIVLDAFFAVFFTEIGWA